MGKKKARKKVVRLTKAGKARLMKARKVKQRVKRSVRRIIKKVSKKNTRKKTVSQMTFADHATAWAEEKGIHVPKRNTKAFQKLYERWAKWAFANLRCKTKRVIKKNPKRRTSKISSKALAMFRKIHGCDPDKIIKMGSGDENLIVLGEVLEVAYRVPFPTKRDKGDTEWVHKFKKKPILALTPSGKPCILFMKDHKITDRGLIG